MYICSICVLSFMYSLDMYRLCNPVATFALPEDESGRV